jgi:hypothetical protein
MTKEKHWGWYSPKLTRLCLLLNSKRKKGSARGRGGGRHRAHIDVVQKDTTVHGVVTIRYKLHYKPILPRWHSEADELALPLEVGSR